MILQGRGIGHGTAEGEILLSLKPISFLGGVNPSEGRIIDIESDIQEESFSGKILVFPFGKGSTVGSYVIYQLKKSGTAPLAIVNQNADPIVATGAILAEIPMIHKIPIDILASGDSAIVDANRGSLELPKIDLKTTVTAILRENDRILILKRSMKVGSFQGRWAGVSGGMLSDESAEEAAVREIEEETTLKPEDYSFAVRGEAIYVRHDDIVWKVHPFLVNLRSGEVSIDWEHEEFRWVTQQELQSYETVPKLDTVIESLLNADAVTGKRVC